MYRFSIIGAGNLAWHLVPALENAGLVCDSVYSRNKNNARKLIGKSYQAKLKLQPEFGDDPPDLLFLTVPDQEIQALSNVLELKTKTILLHCSGSQPIGVLKHKPCGVFYPLQTFTRNTNLINFNKVPVLIEGSDSEITDILIKIASLLSRKIYQVNSESRLQVHLAAVYSCNLVNHLLYISEGILDHQGLKLDLLQNLVEETIGKAFKLGAFQAQTGPAVRGDLEILDKHLNLLNQKPESAEIYRVISQAILNAHQPE
jgi:predicted short-subunit dehydrogenase-like oxidoreductase (DUF2520 family)